MPRLPQVAAAAVLVTVNVVVTIAIVIGDPGVMRAADTYKLLSLCAGSAALVYGVWSGRGLFMLTVALAQAIAFIFFAQYLNG